MNSPYQLKFYIIASLIIILNITAFWNVQYNDFINYDDNEYITDNPYVKAGLTIEGLKWAFTATTSSHWHPLTWLSLMLDCELFGLNPSMHHLMNLLFHTINTLLLFHVMTKMTGALWASAFVAILFGIHPLRVESVAWATERKDVLSTMFWMLTMWAYVKYVEKGDKSRYGAMLLFFILGLMSKPMLVTLPFALLLLDYWPLRRFNGLEWNKMKALVWEKAPLFIIAVISAALAFTTQSSGGTVISVEALPLEYRIANAWVSYVSYIWKTIWPENLALFYPHLKTMLPLWKALVSEFLILIITVIGIRWTKKQPYFIVGWLWYLGTLVPVIMIIQIGACAMADRFAYIPSIGLYIIAAWLLKELAGKFRYGVLLAPTVAITAVFIFISFTWNQVKYWKNSTTIFRRALEVTENNSLAHNNLASALLADGKRGEAIEHYTRALTIEPGDSKTFNNLGLALADEKRYEDALFCFKEALRISPENAKVYSNLGRTLSAIGNKKSAIASFKKAIELDKDFAEPHNNLGLIYMEKKMIDKAITHYREAVKINKNYAVAHNSLGIALAEINNPEEALIHYQKAFQIDRHYIDPYNNMGNLFFSKGKLSRAIEQYNKALEIDPGLNNIRNNLAVVLYMSKQWDRAMREFTKVVEKDSDNFKAHLYLGHLNIRKGKTKEGVEHYKEALRIKPDSSELHNNMGVALMELGKRDEAVKHFAEALRINPNYTQAMKNLGYLLRNKQASSQ